MYELTGEQPRLERPVLVVCLEGWIDAGYGAQAAVASLLGSLTTQVVATFDAEELLDSRARRPVLHLVDGVNTGLTWPEVQLRAGKDRAGSDLLLLVGPEPDLRWRAFTRSVAELARRLDVRLAVGLGAFPAPVPHTRPVRLASTATTPELAAQVGFVPGALDVPAGVQAALERGFSEAGIPATGVWARVPHYVAAMPYPAASAALVDGLAAVSGLVLDSTDLHAAAALGRQRIDELIAQSDEHTAMVRQLEAQADAEEVPPPLDLKDLPTGDELADELQRFLRGE